MLIVTNNALTGLDGLSGITSIAGDLRIDQNQILTNCSLGIYEPIAGTMHGWTTHAYVPIWRTRWNACSCTRFVALLGAGRVRRRCRPTARGFDDAAQFGERSRQGRGVMSAAEGRNRSEAVPVPVASGPAMRRSSSHRCTSVARSASNGGPLGSSRAVGRTNDGVVAINPLHRDNGFID